MKIRWKDMIAFSPDGGGAGAGTSAGSEPGAGAGSGAGSGSGSGAGSGTPSGNLADAAARIAAQNGNGGQQQQQGQQQSGGQQPPAAYYPEGLPEALRGTSDRETIDKLYGDISGRPKAPATAKDYKYEFAAEFVQKYGDLKDDPFLPMWSEVAYELGLTNDQAQNVVPKLFDRLTKSGLIPAPVDANAELEKLEPGETDPVRRTAKAAARVNAIATTIKGLVTRNVLTKTDATRLSVMFENAANVVAFEKILKLLPVEHGLQNGGQATDGRSAYQKQLDAFYPSMSKTN